MAIKIALAGNPNCGKTTLFNELTGSRQYVGNWPGVTVEKKEGQLKGHNDVIIQDLPGIYSLSPYTLEEVVSREYLVKEQPDAILNIIDGTNLERNLYLTTQLIELGLPVVVMINMMDAVRKRGDKINTEKLSAALGCPVVVASALEKEGIFEAAEQAVLAASEKKTTELPHVFEGGVEHAIAHIEESIVEKTPARNLRWFAIKLFERDAKAVASLQLTESLKEHLELHIKDCEKEFDDDSESIIVNQRYSYISSILNGVLVKANVNALTTSDKIDQIVTNRFLALPIFAFIMFMVYYIAIGSIGAEVTDWTNDTLFGEIVTEQANEWLEAAEVAPWLQGLVVDGIIGGVGAVLGFVPQIIILFLMLSLLEDVGYLARVAFIMDRVFRKFGLSGKSFIPMLISSGCGVPGVMASRTIEAERDRRMTIMTTCFVPCSAKMPIIGLIAGALFDGSGLVATSAYFIGIFSVIFSGIVLKKTNIFAGDAVPFVMELPAYHMPTFTNIWRSTWERASSFIVRAGTVIFVSAVILWFMQAFGFVDGSLEMVEDSDASILAAIGGFIAPLFAPLGFGSWQATVATFTGLIAKENVVGTFGVLYGAAEVAEEGDEIWANIAADFTMLSAYSFMIFNLLCAPCFAAMGAIRREMNNGKWTAIAIGYMTGYAYLCAFTFYQIGMFAFGYGFNVLTALAFMVLAWALYLLFRPTPKAEGEISYELTTD